MGMDYPYQKLLTSLIHMAMSPETPAERVRSAISRDGLGEGLTHLERLPIDASLRRQVQDAFEAAVAVTDETATETIRAISDVLVTVSRHRNLDDFPIIKEG